jgi:hypothetical protein
VHVISTTPGRSLFTSRTQCDEQRPKFKSWGLPGCAHAQVPKGRRCIMQLLGDNEAVDNMDRARYISNGNVELPMATTIFVPSL